MSRCEALLAEMMEALMCGCDEIRLPRGCGTAVAAEVVGMVYSSTSGLDDGSLRRFVERTGLEQKLLGRAARSRGYRRAAWLAMLGRLPLSRQAAADVTPYLLSNNPLVRLEALTVMLAAEPASALATLGDHPHRVTALEVAEVMSVLRRGRLPVAWEPLLEDSRVNLRRVGMALVRQFGIDEAEPHLVGIAGCEDATLGGEALVTLCLLGRPLRRAGRLCGVAGFDSRRRRSLLRLVAAEGYALAALDGVIGAEDKPYYATRVNSYKRMLA